MRRFSFLVLAFLLAFFHVFAGAGSAQTCSPPAAGDWLVNETVVCSGQTVTLNGSLLVNASGNLTLLGSTLLFNSSFNGQLGLESNGSLHVLGSGIGSGTGMSYSFISNAGAGLEIRNSRISGCGMASPDASRRGVYVASTGATITNSTFSGNYFAMIMQAGNGNVRDSIFRSNAMAVSIFGNGIVFSGNVLENNTAPIPAAELRTNNSILDNNSVSNNAGTGIRLSGQANNVTNSRISNNGNIGLEVIDSQGAGISGNTILGNAYGLYVSYSRDVFVTSNLINGSGQFDVYVLSSPNVVLSATNYTTMLKRWRLAFTVVDNETDPVPGAGVVIKNAYNSTVFSGAANSTGGIPIQILDERKENQSGVFAYSPYSVEASGNGYASNYSAFSMTGDLFMSLAITPFVQPNPFFIIIGSPKNATYIRYNLSDGIFLPVSVDGASNLSSCNYSVSNISGQMTRSGPAAFQASLNTSGLEGGYRINISCLSADNLSAYNAVWFSVYPSFECVNSQECGSEQTCIASRCVNLECRCGFAENHACVSYECCSDTDCGDRESCDTSAHVCSPVICGCPEMIGNHICGMEAGYCCKDLQCSENETCDLSRHECMRRLLSLEIGGELVFGSKTVVSVKDQDGRPVENVRIDVKYLDTDPFVMETVYTDGEGNAEVEIKHAGTVELVARKGGYFTGNASKDVPPPFDFLFLAEALALIGASAGIAVTALKLRGKRVSTGGPLALEKTVSGTSVMLRVSNKTKKKLEEILIRDSVPAGAFMQCSVMPKIEPLDEKTSSLTWEILQLGPGEDVSIQYEAYSTNRGFSVLYKGKEYRD